MTREDLKVLQLVLKNGDVLPLGCRGKERGDSRQRQAHAQVHGEAIQQMSAITQAKFAKENSRR